MIKATSIALCMLLLATSVLGQAAVPTCGVSNVLGIASGVINLGAPSAPLAQDSYSLALTGFNLDLFAEVFSAFAIAGFQAASNQQYYSLVVDNIIFSNGNTQMNFTMLYTFNNIKTSWSKIKLSWLAVSTSFLTTNTATKMGQYIWAGSVGLSAPFSGLSGPVMTNSIFATQTAAMIASPECGYLNTSPPTFDVTCTNFVNARFITHLYVMGFQFNPSGQYALAASVLRNAGGQAVTDLDEALITADFVTGAAVSGPRMIINSFGSQLSYIKVGIVITTILDITTYPTANPTTFQYSGVYMNYTLYNVAQPIQRFDPNAVPLVNTAQQNYRFYSLLNTKYQIFGLSAFQIAALPTNMTVINYEVSFPDVNTVLLQTDNVNYLSGVRVSADNWNSLINTCTQTSVDMLNVKEKYLTSVPPIRVAVQNIYETSSKLDFTYWLSEQNALADLSQSVLFTNTLNFENFTAGMAYKIAITFADTLTGLPADTQVQYQVSVQGNVILNKVVTVPNPAPAGIPHIEVIETIGYIFTVSNPTITITLNIPRDVSVTPAPVARAMTTSMVITQYANAYDPVKDCCVQFCPKDNGVNVFTNPPTCVPCTAGLIYNSVAGRCQCQTGYYEVVQANTNSSQCYPCFAPLCQSCNVTSPTICNSCVTGAAVNNNSLCACTPGYYQNGALCTACPYKCLTCNVGTVCNVCSDNTTRSAANNCNCLDGFYDSGSAVCSKCSVLCKTCSAASTCTSCFTENNRALVNGQCVCSTGYYQVVKSDNSLVCEPCDPTCTSCSLLPTLCSNCDANANRILGFNPLGHQICTCQPGYSENGNGNCVQNDCAADPNCASCQTVLGTSTCIRCIAATSRTLVMPQQKCLCNPGLFDLQGVCTSCGSGCALCSSATTCSQCVVSATPNNDGSCSCPNGFFFATTPIRHCKKCPQYCTSCTSATACTAVEANFVLVNGLPICPQGRFINAQGQCVPCVTGCQTCTSATSCQVCNIPLLLQDNSCVSRCGPGFYQSGFTCLRCSSGCAACSQANICTFCQSGRLAYNGECFINCPAGSVASLNTSTCVACNSPCATCTEHPSKCLTCASCCGSLFNFQCLASCPVGTYSNNGKCEYCSYNCATCLGTSTTCTSCPSGKVLFSGACYDKCPYVMIGGICSFNCARGLFKTAINQCANCSSVCSSCEGNANNCTSCVSGFAVNGTCQRNCPLNFFARDGLCQACNPECNGCVEKCDNCIDCAIGYYKCGSLCVKTCYPNQFIDEKSRTCITCNAKCKTCSSQQFCTTCANPQAVPVNGVCNDCSYPCNTCGSGPSVCTSCVSGFNLIGSTCIADCPSGAAPVNGVCQCRSGFIYSNQCVASCPNGWGNIAGQCTKCAENCAACSGSSASCTSCLNGYALNAVTGVCQVAPSCQFGQYFSQSSNACARICPQSTYYYESVCLTACLQGYQDNGVGGCVAIQVQTGCSYPYFLSNGVCISNCPATTYADSQSRVCKACSANCFSCLTNTFCYACNAGYDLKNGVCISTSVTCPSGQLRYNGNCYVECPIGTCAQGNYCQRTCPAGTWAYNNGCYRDCPTDYNTNDACVESCPAGTTLQNGVCQVGAQSCPSGQFFDPSASACKACQYPCTQCSLTASYCTACASGLTLNQNLCVSTSNSCGNGKFQDVNKQCQPCPAKCANCISATSCSTCATGYNFNGFDCVVTLNKLQKVVLTVQNVCRRDNVAFVTVCPNILPNGLTVAQRNNFFQVVPNQNDKVTLVNQFISSTSPNCVVVAVTYATFPTQSSLFLTVNSVQLASAYSSIGYTTDSSTFVSASINVGLNAAPATLTIPANADNANAGDASNVAYAIYSNAVNTGDILA